MASYDESRPKTIKYSNKTNNAQGEKGKRKRQFTPRKRVSESEDDGICDLCILPMKIYAIGHCNHPICHRCSAKMRILCEEMHCAVCRVELKKVIYCKSRRQFSDANSLHLLKDKKENNWFTDEIVKKEYLKLFENRCSLCPNLEPFFTFDKLKAHIRKEHQLQFCDICVTNNKNFTDEYKTYNRETLGRHRRLGDEDDTSHRGHPLCVFCDERYVDNDALLLHLRTDHYFCHFCDKAGSNEYYAGYMELREHYGEKHFLCEEGDCKDEQFTSVFSSELDFKAHQAAAHAGNMSRQQQKAERKIDLGFQYANRPGRGGRGGGRSEDYSGGGRGRGRGRGRSNREEEDFEMAKALSLSEQENKKGGSKPAGRPRVKTREEEQRKTPPIQEEPAPPDFGRDFPTLGASKEPESVSSTCPSTNQPQPLEKPPPPETRNEVQSAASMVASTYGRSMGRITEEDFPTLGSAKKGPGSHSGGIWGTPLSAPQSGGGKSSNRPKPQPTSVNMPAAPFGNRRVDLRNKEEFPSLGGGPGPTLGNKSTWGQTPVATSAPKKSATKNKPQPAKAPRSQPARKEQTYQATPQLQTQKPVRNTDMIAQDETVSIRIGSGKHSMRLASAKHNEDITDIERPVEVPGFGNTSVKTVTADTFSLLSSSISKAGNKSTGFHAEGGSDFPELGGGGGRGGRIKGIGGPRLPGDTWGVTKNTKKSKKASMTLSDIGNDIFPSSTIESVPSGGKKKAGKARKAPASSDRSTPLENVNGSVNDADFPAISQPPPLSSYPSNWKDDDFVPVADRVIRDSSFQVETRDFPSLGGNEARQNQTGGKKNKKKKKNKKIQDANNLSKHFGNVAIEDESSGGKLENLLKGQRDVQNSLSTILDQNGMFDPTSTTAQAIAQDHNTDQSAAVGLTLDEDFDDEEKCEDEDYDGVILQPRPDDDDINGRNMWLIEAVQQLCGTEHNYSEFKTCSAEFRRGTMFAQSYYEKCMGFFGARHFSEVFGELVNLLPDEGKRTELLLVHNSYMANG